MEQETVSESLKIVQTSRRHEVFHKELMENL